MKLLRFLVLATCYAFASRLYAQPAKATYNGLFLSTNDVCVSNSGSFTLTTSSAGKFSGKLQIGNSRAPITGTFIGGLASVTAHPTKTQTLNVQLQWDASTDRITGTVDNGLWSADLVAGRAGFDGKSLLAPQAGHYTIIIPGTSNSPGSPTADGFGTVNVSTAGRIALAGSLGDGTKLTQSTSLSTNGQWPFFISLYKGQGSVLSRVAFTNSEQSAISGNLHWIKPASPSAKYFPGGFTNQTEIVGFVYTQPPKGNSVLQFTIGAVTFDGGNLAQSITNHVLLDGNNRINNLDRNKLSMSLTLTTGAFRGSVTDPATMKAIPFAGVVVQDQNRGTGNFLGSSQSGQVHFGQSGGDVVQFQTIGSSFAPEISYNAGAGSAFRWLWSDSSTSSSTNPTKQFPNRAERSQLLSAYPSGVLTGINLGFDGSDGPDNGPTITPFSTNSPQQNVSAVYFPYPLTGLRYWASSYNPITNTLDFSGFTSLEDIECWHCTNLEAVVVTNLPSIRRVCFEACYLPELDLTGNPNLEDIRAALNTFSEVKIGGGTGPKVWHFCTRENHYITQRFQDIMTNFYSLREPWIWNDNQSGHLSFVSTNLTDVEFWGNDYTSADLSGQTNMFFLQGQENSLTNLVITGCTALQYFEAERNNLPSEVLNQIVVDLQSCPDLQFVDLTHNGDLGFNGFLTSPDALNAYTNLINQGIHIYVDWPQ